MERPGIPKYQAIEAILRQRIRSGEYRPGSRLPAQEELATQFGVTLMTLRQAIAALEASGLVWAARGKGTFVADSPIDIRLDNLSSFAAQMRASGSELATQVLEVATGSPESWPMAARALEIDQPLVCVTRLRLVDGTPLSLQRSHLDHSVTSAEHLEGLGDTSLYDLIEEQTGWTVAEARETITAVGLNQADAEALGTEIGQAALLSTRTSINQFGQPYLYDDALLVGGRSEIVADRRSDRLSLRYELHGDETVR